MKLGLSELYCVMILHYTEILEINLFAFAYVPFHEDFSSLKFTLLTMMFGEF